MVCHVTTGLLDTMLMMLIPRNIKHVTIWGQGHPDPDLSQSGSTRSMDTSQAQFSKV